MLLIQNRIIFYILCIFFYLIQYTSTESVRKKMTIFIYIGSKRNIPAKIYIYRLSDFVLDYPTPLAYANGV